jgi:pimeloyl-ACP methyl ester carboxylesterase
MPYLTVNGTQLYYEDEGQGKPILFIHGLWGSCRFFEKQLDYFTQRYRVLLLDLRGHGRSAPIHSGYTMANYARDIHELMHRLELTKTVLVGWSMGAFVVWDYFKQFGAENVKATVIVDQSASDFKRPDWPTGAFDFAEICRWMANIQTDRAEAMREFISFFFKGEPTTRDLRWMLDEMTRIPASIAGAVLFAQSVEDYRGVLPNVNVPTLICFGRGDKFFPIAAGEYLNQNLPQAQMVVFEQSGHCPFLEEPERFNKEVDQFLRSLS